MHPAPPFSNPPSALPTMTTALDQAKQAWHQALKLRKHLTKQIDKLRANSTSGTDIAQFDVVDEALGQFRLACVTTIFLDMEYANKEDSESILWQQHVTINSEFRRILGKLRQDSRVVEKRKVETKYGHFLRIAQQFYQGYIQRLAMRYDVSELRRIAQSIEANQQHSKDMISPVPANLSVMILASCHSTLIRLGDLSRYRVQAKHKKSYETAMAFYGLAHDVMPDSGFGFHQMGIVSLEEGNHLDVVYHFYRSWAVKEPHPLAKQNLESKFKSLQNHSSSSRAKASSPSPNDTFVLWFVRLQALFYKGEPVSSQQNELEREVFHRMTMAIRDVASAPMLFKMGLVNISAHCIASMKNQDAKTESSARFYQHVLHFNMRFILKLCEAIKADIAATASSEEFPNSAEPNAAPSSKDALLPLLRVYCIWIASRTSEIYTSPDSPGNIVPPMTQTLASVLTSFCTELSNNADTVASCPYLLPEDIEIRGLTSLSDDSVPVACRGYCDDNGQMKPHPDSQSQRQAPSQESTARLLDILRCAYSLTEDPNVPLICSAIESGLEFRYQDRSQPSGEPVLQKSAREPVLQKPAREPALQKPAREPALQKSSRESILQKPAREPILQKSTLGPAREPAREPIKEPELARTPEKPVLPGFDTSRNSSQWAQPAQNNANTYQGAQYGSPAMPPVEDRPQEQVYSTPATHLRPMNDADETVVNMLSPFLDCPTPKSEQNTYSPKESSYGMHSTTASELAQELLKTFQPEKDEPVPYYESINAQRYASSGWNGMFMAAPSKAQLPRSPQTTGQALPSFSGQIYDGSPGGSMPAEGHHGSPFSMPTGRGAAVPSLMPAPGFPQQQQQAFGVREQQQQQQQQSQFDTWSSYQMPNSVGQLPRNHAQQQQQRSQGAVPISSNSSVFSHPSSVYQGTPASVHGPSRLTAQTQGGAYGIGYTSNGVQGQSSISSLSSGRPFQMNQTSSNYDAAVFEAAMNGQRFNR